MLGNNFRFAKETNSHNASVAKRSKLVVKSMQKMNNDHLIFWIFEFDEEGWSLRLNLVRKNDKWNTE